MQDLTLQLPAWWLMEGVSISRQWPCRCWSPTCLLLQRRLWLENCEESPRLTLWCPRLCPGTPPPHLPGRDCLCGGCCCSRVLSSGSRGRPSSSLGMILPWKGHCKASTKRLMARRWGCSSLGTSASGGGHTALQSRDLQM